MEYGADNYYTDTNRTTARDNIAGATILGAVIGGAGGGVAAAVAGGVIGGGVPLAIWGTWRLCRYAYRKLKN